MVDDYPIERKIRQYAIENNFTLVANTPGTLEYVKYNKNSTTMTIMRWPKGSKSVVINKGSGEERINLNNLLGS